MQAVPESASPGPGHGTCYSRNHFGPLPPPAASRDPQSTSLLHSAAHILRSIKSRAADEFHSLSGSAGCRSSSIGLEREQ